MAKTKDEAAKTAAQPASAGAEKKTRKKPAEGEVQRAKASRAKASEPEADGDAAPRRRPAAPVSRPSIYDAITATANKAEADRAAKAAARKAAASQQSAAAKPAAPSAQVLRSKASPFLNAPLTRAVPAPSTRPAEEARPGVDASSAALTAPTAAGAATLAPGQPSPAIAPERLHEAGEVAPPAAPGLSEALAVPSAAPAQAVGPATEQRIEAVQPDTQPDLPGAKLKPSTGGKAGLATAQSAQVASGTGASIAAPKPARGAPRTQTPATTRPSGPRPSTTTRMTPATPRPAPGKTPAREAPAVAPAHPATTESRPAAKPVQPQPGPAQKPVVKPAVPVVPKPAPPPAPVPAGPVAIPSVLSVRELATLLSVPSGDLIKRLMTMGIFATINQALDYDTATLIAEEFSLKTRRAEVPTPTEDAKPSLRTLTAAGEQDTGRLRPPVVTVLGHVDHGKTSLLDAIRSAKVAAGEAGGITQHIGAYQADRNGRKITFLDTPGHEAFTAMRARGAQVTDVAILVVAADDGVMPQTKEAINHVRAANVPMVVALNKIDRETADPSRVMRQLADANVVVEQWGGDTPMVPVSAKKNIGIDELLEMILLVADLAELKANPDAPAVGTVIEAQVDRSRGPVATLLVQNGTLRQNDYIVVEGVHGRVRAMFDDKGNRLNEAGPSTPVLVLGMPSVPQAGSIFRVAADERSAKQAAEDTATAHAQTVRSSKTLSLDELYTQMEAGKMHDLNIVLKADVQGSLEPIRNSIERLSTENLKVRLLHEGLGNISESDVSLALASGAIVIGFHVDADPAARKLANSEGVDIRLYDIIYELIEDVDKALKGLLEPTFKDVVSGKADVRQVFKVNKRAVAGCYITEGKALRSGMARVLRGGKQVFDGRVASLKRFTEDVREVNTGFECGVMLEGFEDFQTGDVIEFYHKEKEE